MPGVVCNDSLPGVQLFFGGPTAGLLQRLSACESAQHLLRSHRDGPRRADHTQRVLVGGERTCIRPRAPQPALPAGQCPPSSVHRPNCTGREADGAKDHNPADDPGQAHLPPSLPLPVPVGPGAAQRTRVQVYRAGFSGQAAALLRPSGVPLTDLGRGPNPCRWSSHSEPCVPATSARVGPGAPPRRTLPGNRVSESIPWGTSRDSEAAAPGAAVIPPTPSGSSRWAGAGPVVSGTAPLRRAVQTESGA